MLLNQHIYESRNKSEFIRRSILLVAYAGRKAASPSQVAHSSHIL
jgi:hypothetical protein